MRIAIDAVALLLKGAGVKNYIYYWTAHLMRDSVCFAGLAIRAYAQSLVVYENAHQFNKIVSMAYSADHTEQDQFVYPVPEVVTELKAGLKRLRLGPYRVPAVHSADSNAAGAALRELAKGSLEDTFHIDGLRADPQLGEILFAHPTSRYALAVARETKSLQVDYGILAAALRASPSTDGVEFRLLLAGPAGERIVWSRWLRPVTESGDRGNQHVKVALEPGPGERVIFETRPGATTDNDWAYWSNLVVTGH
jgi:hypothetical protein